ncbi:Unknown protein, partial [Striga hermonthica]
GRVFTSRNEPIHKEPSNLLVNLAPESLASNKPASMVNHKQQGENNPPRSLLRDMAQPMIGPVTSCIWLGPAARNYEIKTIHYNQLPSFYGLPNEDSLHFIREFYNVLQTFPLQGLNEDQLKMRCFPHTLKDRAKDWFMNLAPDSLTTWEQVYSKFIGKYYSHQKTQELRGQIVSFTQHPNEPFHETWERFKDLQRQCPHHNLPPGLLVSRFYDSLDRNLQFMVNVNLPLFDVIKNMPSYVKFFKDLVTKKRKFGDGEKVVVYEAASAMHHDLPKKERDPGGFIIKIALGNGKEASGMLDLGAGINLMPFSIFQKLGLGDLRPTRMCLQLVDRSIRYPKGVVEDVLVRIGKLIVPVDFVVLDVGDVLENGKDHTILLGRPFMATTNTLIDVKNGTLNMMVLGESVSISVREAMSASSVLFIEE